MIASTAWIQSFGDVSSTIPKSDEYLTLTFSPRSNARNQRWSNYGLSADFLGDYFAAFFPGDAIPDSKINRRDTVKATVSFIANELLENAVKYTDPMTDHAITLSLYLHPDTIIFHAINHSSAQQAAQYQKFIQNLIASDLDTVYAQQLEKTAMGEGGSCMGLLTLMSDYGARIAWAFQSIGAIAPDSLVNSSLQAVSLGDQERGRASDGTGNVGDSAHLAQIENLDQIEISVVVYLRI